MAETVLVTGGTGFVGGWCIVELLKRGYNVRTTVRSAAKEAAVRSMVTATDPRDRLSFAIADLTSDAGWDPAVVGCDYVLHVASPLGLGKQTPDELIATARDGVSARAARGGESGREARGAHVLRRYAIRRTPSRKRSVTKKSGPIRTILSSQPIAARKPSRKKPPGISWRRMVARPSW